MRDMCKSCSWKPKCKHLPGGTFCTATRLCLGDKSGGIVAELEEMLQKMKPECELCRVTKEIRTPAVLKGGDEGFYEWYYGVDVEIDPIRSQIKYCPACGRKL